MVWANGDSDKNTIVTTYIWGDFSFYQYKLLWNFMELELDNGNVLLFSFKKKINQMKHA